MTEHLTDDARVEDDKEGRRTERLSVLADLFGADGPPDLDDVAGPTYWPELVPREAHDAWMELRSWVGQLIERFPHLDHHVIPLCWFRHPGHVEALSALRDHERVSYADTAPATAAVDWHRAFRDIEARLREWTAQLSCGATHESRLRQIRPVQPDEWDHFVQDDMARRDSAALAVALDDGGSDGQLAYRLTAQEGSQGGQRMSVRTVWSVKHSCGHDQDHDLGDRRPSERASFARWLEHKDCSDCWRAGRERANGKDKEAWLAERRAEEAAAVGSWETNSGMPALVGSDKAVGWGSRVRHQLMTDSYDHHVRYGAMSDDEFEDRFERPARTVTSAAWWIDLRDTDPSDLEELLADVSEDARAEASENPY
jgi:hypothetical protein